MTTSSTTALQRLKDQRDKLNAKIQKAEARTKTIERKRDLRRKILIGAYYLDRAHREGKYPQLLQRLETYLTRPTDRQLFDLTVLDDK